MKHPLINKVLFKASRTLYKNVYRTLNGQKHYEDAGLPAYSVMDALMDYLFGRKYYTVLMKRPNLKMRGTKGLCVYETSSDIFFSEDEAWAYYEKMHDASRAATLRSCQIISFRSKEKIPVWNMQRDPECDMIAGIK